MPLLYNKFPFVGPVAVGIPAAAGFLSWGDQMLTDQEKNTIIRALMFFKKDCDAKDVNILGFKTKEECQSMVQTLIEDFIGLTWDEETTTANINAIIKSLTRNRTDDQQLKLFPEET